MSGNDIRELLRLLVRSLGMLDNERTSRCSLSLSQCHTLVEIGRSGRMNVNELANLMDLNKSTASRHVQALVTKGMIERHESTDDRRFLDLQLTDQGREAFDDIEMKMNDFYDKVFDKIPDGKEQQVIESLKILTEVIGDTDYV